MPSIVAQHSLLTNTQNSTTKHPLHHGDYGSCLYFQAQTGECELLASGIGVVLLACSKGTEGPALQEQPEKHTEGGKEN
eukprot:6467281-Amphidinium_carterae.1